MFSKVDLEISRKQAYTFRCLSQVRCCNAVVGFVVEKLLVGNHFVADCTVNHQPHNGFYFKSGIEIEWRIGVFLELVGWAEIAILVKSACHTVDAIIAANTAIYIKNGTERVSDFDVGRNGKQLPFVDGKTHFAPTLNFRLFLHFIFQCPKQ